MSFSKIENHAGKNTTITEREPRSCLVLGEKRVPKEKNSGNEFVLSGSQGWNRFVFSKGTTFVENVHFFYRINARV